MTQLTDEQMNELVAKGVLLHKLEAALKRACIFCDEQDQEEHYSNNRWMFERQLLKRIMNQQGISIPEPTA